MPATLRLRTVRKRERRLLQRKLRDLSLRARIHRRYRIIEEVRKGYPVPQAADRAGCHVTVAYAWVRRFNESGFTTFEHVSNPRGRPPIVRAGQLRDMVDVALSSPPEQGLPFSTWSVPKLAEFCRSRGLLPEVTDEWVRRLLRRAGLTAQRLRRRGRSRDPDLDPNKGPSTGPLGGA